MNDNVSLFSPGDHFKIGSKDLLAPVLADSVVDTSNAPEDAVRRREREALDDIRVRVGTLLKTENVSFLLGAGASKDCGGQLISSVPLAVERDLLNQGITGRNRPRIRNWLKVFYLATCRAESSIGCPSTREEILERREVLEAGEAKTLSVNFEEVLATLHRWRSTLPEPGARLRLDGFPRVDVTAEEVDQSLGYATRALARACNLPTPLNAAGLDTFKVLVRKLLTRPLNLKRVNIFTLNYDTLVEQAADAEGVILLEGFVGTQLRVFRPESYEQDLYFPAETTEGRVHRFDRVLHLYKLHGSITWTSVSPTIDNPYGVRSIPFDPDGAGPLLIYPTPTKYGDVLGMPYSELFRRFAGTVARPQGVLFVVGYGFGDEHVNSIVRQALTIPSFTLVIVDPKPQSKFVAKLQEQQDQRVWVAEGVTLGKLAGFVEHILPDLRDEEIRKQVLQTYRALKSGEKTDG